MITTIINYCSNEYRFIKKCIDTIRPISSQIIVPVCKKFFDNTDEYTDLLVATYKENPNVDFFEYEYNHDYTLQYGTRFWHNMSRYLGVTKIKDTSNHILFLDADEICDTKLFSIWLSTQNYKKYDAIKLSNYWYFREPIYQAQSFEDSILLTSYNNIITNQNFMLMTMERDGMFNSLSNNIRNVMYNNTTPMFHHYSWVRNKEQMLHKVKAWGHNKDRDWVKLVEDEFSHEFNGTDFIHGYKYNVLNKGLL